MTTLTVAWILSALALLVVGSIIGRMLNLGITGIFIDTRGRYSLSQFQIVLWTVLVLSLISGLLIARWIAGAENPLGFTIPNDLLIVMGISIGGTAAAVTIKSAHDTTNPDGVAATGVEEDPENPGQALQKGGKKVEVPPRWIQIFLVEEGDFADKIVDVTKYQNFWITVLLVTAYIVLVVGVINRAAGVLDVKLPEFGDTFLVLLGVSHAGYLAGKLPTRAGNAQYSLTKRKGALKAALI